MTPPSTVHAALSIAPGGCRKSPRDNPAPGVVERLALYHVALADGTIVRVPNTDDGATEPMAGRGGLVFSQPQTDSNIYRLDLRNGHAIGAARPIVASSRADDAPHISPDGRSIAFLSVRAGGRDIWVALQTPGRELVNADSGLSTRRVRS